MQALNLPPNPTLEQFSQAEPVLIKAILEDQYIDGIEDLTRVDADPQQNQYFMTGAGSYSGIFTDIDGDLQFSFELDDEGVSYEPVNPSAIADGEETNA